MCLSRAACVSETDLLVSCEIWPSSTEFGQRLAKFGTCWPSQIRIWSNLAHCRGPKMAEIGRYLRMLAGKDQNMVHPSLKKASGRMRPDTNNVVQICRSLSKTGQHLATSARSRAAHVRWGGGRSSQVHAGGWLCKTPWRSRTRWSTALTTSYVLRDARLSVRFVARSANGPLPPSNLCTQPHAFGGGRDFSWGVYLCLPAHHKSPQVQRKPSSTAALLNARGATGAPAPKGRELLCDRRRRAQPARGHGPDSCLGGGLERDHLKASWCGQRCCTLPPSSPRFANGPPP